MIIKLLQSSKSVLMESQRLHAIAYEVFFGFTLLVSYKRRTKNGPGGKIRPQDLNYD